MVIPIQTEYFAVCNWRYYLVRILLNRAQIWYLKNITSNDGISNELFIDQASLKNTTSSENQILSLYGKCDVNDGVTVRWNWALALFHPKTCSSLIPSMNDYYDHVNNFLQYGRQRENSNVKANYVI